METLRFLMVSTHFPPYHLGGDAVFVLNLSNELARKGHEVRVLYNPAAYELLRHGPPSVRPEEYNEGVTGVPFKSKLGRLNPIVALSLGSWSAAERKLRSVAKDFGPDIVHWHNTRGFIGVPSSIGGAANLYTAHDYSLVCPKWSLLKPDRTICEDHRYCVACSIMTSRPPQLWRMGKSRRIRLPPDLKVLAPSNFMAEVLRQDGFQVSHVLRNFVPDPGVVARASGAASESLVYLGMLERHKGVRTLLDAFVRGSAQHGFNLDIIGDGRMREELRRDVTARGMKGRVTVHGFLERSKMQTIRKDAAAQIVPSEWYENAPLVVLESLALGVPVIASKIGGLPEIVEGDSGSGLFQPGSVPELSNALVDMWSSRKDLDTRRRKARMIYEERYTPERHMTDYLGIVAESR